MAHRLPPRVEASDESSGQKKDGDDKKKKTDKKKSKKTEKEKKEKKTKKKSKNDDDEEDGGVDSDHNPLGGDDDPDDEDGGSAPGHELDDGIPDSCKPAKRPATARGAGLKRPAARGQKRSLGSDGEQDRSCVWNMGRSHSHNCLVSDFTYF